jgi:hypothetical protein
MNHNPKKSLVYLITILSLSGLTSSCAIKQKGDGKQGKPKPWDPGQRSADAFDFAQNCGLNENAPDDAIVFSQNLKSLNFIVEAGMANIKARIEADAKLEINSKATSGSQKIDVSVNKVTDLSNNPTGLKNLITRIAARIVAKSRGGTMTSNAVPFKDWIKLVDGDNPEYKGLLCAVTGEASVEKQEDKAKRYEFSPGLISSINPKASAEQRQKEIGNGRKFSIDATLLNPISKRVVATTSGSVQIRPVDSQLKATDPITKKVISIQADSAYEVISDFTSGKTNFENFNSKITFYLDHNKRNFMAITQEELPSAAESEFKMPVIVMLPQ